MLTPFPPEFENIHKSITAKKVSNKNLNIYSDLVEFKNESNLFGVIAT